ncbi:hypothetical protein BGZ88_006261, partial [Linnemannia elongata]
TGTTEGPSELLRRIGRLYSAEQGRKVEAAVEKDKLAQQRRENYRLATPLPTANTFNTTHELACNVLELLKRDAEESTNTETLLGRFEQSNNRLLEAMQMQSRDVLEAIREQTRANQRESRDFRTALLRSQNQMIELAKALTRKQ